MPRDPVQRLNLEVERRLILVGMNNFECKFGTVCGAQVKDAIALGIELLGRRVDAVQLTRQALGIARTEDGSRDVEKLDLAVHDQSRRA
ncbi:MAG: hypothetical protein ACREB3_13110 [Burkholderiales bacterium]